MLPSGCPDLMLHAVYDIRQIEKHSGACQNDICMQDIKAQNSDNR